METFVVDILRSDAEKMIQRMSWSRYTFSASISDIFIFFEYFFFFGYVSLDTNPTSFQHPIGMPHSAHFYSEYTNLHIYILLYSNSKTNRLLLFFSVFFFYFCCCRCLNCLFILQTIQTFFVSFHQHLLMSKKKCVSVVLFGDCCDCALVVVAVVEANKVHTYLTHTRSTRFDYSKCSNVCVCDIAFVGSDRWYFSCYSWRFVSASHTHSRLAEKVNRMHFSANVIAIRLLCTVGVYSISWGLCLCLAIAHAIQQKHSLQGDE